MSQAQQESFVKSARLRKATDSSGVARGVPGQGDSYTWAKGWGGGEKSAKFSCKTTKSVIFNMSLTSHALSA